MIDRILRLGKEAAIYGLSSIFGRLLNFLLVPFYTNVLLPSEYGVIANLYAFIAFAAILYGYGLDSAFMRYWASKEIGDRKQNFSTPLVSLFVSSSAFSLLLHVLARPVSDAIGMMPDGETLVRLAAWILFFDTMAQIPYSYLRMENKAGTFATIRIMNIVLTVLLNIVLIVGFDMRAEGVLLANLIASVATMLIHLRSVISNFTSSFSVSLFKELMKFGLPYLPAGLASIAMQVVDRPILMALTDDATVGIYQANYRLGVFMMLVVGMFDYAWRPFFLKHSDDPDARKLFARVFTYFSLLAMLLFVFVSLFIEDLIRIKIGSVFFIHPDYWSGVMIVPVVLLAYALNGAYANFVIGVYLKKKTGVLPAVFGAGAIANVGANYLLIPPFGIMGAAYATLMGYLVLALGIYFASQKLYGVEYEWRKVLSLLGLSILIVVLFILYDFEPVSMNGFLGKTGLMAAFLVLIVAFRIVNTAEVKETYMEIRKFLRPPRS